MVLATDIKQEGGSFYLAVSTTLWRSSFLGLAISIKMNGTIATNRLRCNLSVGQYNELMVDTWLEISRRIFC